MGGAGGWTAGIACSGRNGDDKHLLCDETDGGGGTSFSSYRSFVLRGNSSHTLPLRETLVLRGVPISLA